MDPRSGAGVPGPVEDDIRQKGYFMPDEEKTDKDDSEKEGCCGDCSKCDCC